ncbi:MAG: methionine--tRNA ligase [Flavobacteriaceae bacterium]|nr:methionine--tRNA ligase [Flavobacteriaceae bacterium]|tara:strand:- start:185 stop:2230 length:2046 start_codon:yes stop_codon:yes gene_type:complete
MSKAKRYTLTAALPYTNGPIHIGHLAGVYIPADTYARYLRNREKDVAFICGSDEHGVAIAIKAKNEKKTPKEVIDKYDNIIRSSFDSFGISFDNYSRTSSKIHHETAQNFFKDLNEKNIFIQKNSEQLFDEQANQFLADRFVTGTCPICKNIEAYGDQCESCGSSLNSSDLINPKSTLSGAVPVKKKTNHWYLPLNDYEDFIKKWILDGHKKDWKSNVYGQVKSWIENGLQPRAVTRDLEWGIPVPVKNNKGKVLYVWFDAPIGYISSTKEWALRKGIDWQPYWKDKNTELIHFIGKDNIVFHCIIFPVMLKASGKYILPKNVPANEFLNLEGNKISTSKNWAVWLHEYLIDFPNQQDVLRYVLTANAPESKDNDFTWKEFQARNNNELVAIYGNFINRVVVLTHKYYDGKVPSPGKLNNEDQIVLDSVVNFQKKISDKIESFKFRESIKELMNLARLGNKYLADHEPWKLIKTSPERVNSIIYVSLQLVAHIAYLSEPFLPFTSHKLLKILNLKKSNWSILRKESILMEDHTINQQELLFSKIEDSQIDQQLNKLNNYKNTNDLDMISKPKPSVDYEIFQSLDIKVGEIINAERIPKTKNILKLKVSIKDKNLIIVSGIANDYDLKEILGQKVTVLVNLKPKKIKGVESQGMILMGKGVSGKNIFISPDQKSVSNGSQIY